MSKARYRTSKTFLVHIFFEIFINSHKPLSLYPFETASPAYTSGWRGEGLRLGLLKKCLKIVNGKL
jgi:hypothetical protein